MDIQLPGTNLSLQQQTNYNLVIDRIPNVVFNVQRFDFPGMNLGVAPAAFSAPTADLQFPGDKMTYDPLTVGALLDEDMVGYKQFRQWMVACSKTRPIPFSDATLIILSNKLNLTQSIRFVNCWASTLGPISFDYSTSPDSPLVFDMTLTYQYYQFSDEQLP